MSRARRTALLACPAAATLAAGVALATPAGATTWPMPPIPSGPYTAPTAHQLSLLRTCESSGRYDTNTGNGFYGAYQFDLPTWHSVGEPSRPDLAPPSVQDRAASILEAERGFEPWPSCSRQYGLRAVPSGSKPGGNSQHVVKQSVSAQLSALTPRVGREIELSGHVSPPVAGVLVERQSLSHGVWRTWDTTRTTSSGFYRFLTRTHSAGHKSYRVAVPSTSSTTGATSELGVLVFN